MDKKIEQLEARVLDLEAALRESVGDLAGIIRGDTEVAMRARAVHDRLTAALAAAGEEKP